MQQIMIDRLIFKGLRCALKLMLASMSLACCAMPSRAADTGDDDDEAAAKRPSIYLDLRTTVARLPSGSLPIGFGSSALSTALHSLAIANGKTALSIPNTLTLPARSALGVDLPLTVDLPDTVSLYAGVSGSTTSVSGIDIASFAPTSWSAGFQVDVYHQNGGMFPTVTLQSTMTGSISSGLLSTITYTNLVEFSYALDRDETRGVLAGVQDTHIAIRGIAGEIRPSLIGYVGAYYQWSNDWRVTLRGGLQSFGGAQILNIVNLPALTQAVFRIDLDQLSDDGNRLFGITGEIMWTPKPTYQLTVRTPLYLTPK